MFFKTRFLTTQKLRLVLFRFWKGIDQLDGLLSVTRFISDLKKTKQNADKSKELNNLVLEYKEIEQVSDLINYVAK